MTRYGGLPAVAGVGFLLLLVAYLAAYVALFAGLVAAATARWGSRARPQHAISVRRTAVPVSHACHTTVGAGTL